MKYFKAKAKKFSKDKPVGPPSSQDLQHKAWEHLLLKSSPLVHQDTRNSPQQQMHCQKQQTPFDAKFIWQTTGSMLGREREDCVVKRRLPYLSTDTLLRESFFNSYESIGFSDRSIDCSSIKWAYWAEIYNLYRKEKQSLFQNTIAESLYTLILQTPSRKQVWNL